MKERFESYYDLARPGGNVAVEVSVSFSAYTGIGVIKSHQISCAVIASHAGTPPGRKPPIGPASAFG